MRIFCGMILVALASFAVRRLVDFDFKTMRDWADLINCGTLLFSGFGLGIVFISLMEGKK